MLFMTWKSKMKTVICHFRKLLSLPVCMLVCKHVRCVLHMSLASFTFAFFSAVFPANSHLSPASSLQVWCLAVAASAAIMFTKKKKSRIQISAPSNFEHRVHTDFDEQEQKFVGLPRQWQSLIEDTAKRPKPFIDVTVITTVEPRKVG